MEHRLENNKQQLFDPVRKKWVAHTPEEHVRQSVVEYLRDQVGVPVNLCCVEYCLTNIDPGNLKQVDILVWKPGRAGEGKQLTPWLLVECKAPTVKIDEELEFQVLHYLHVVRCDFLMLTNGADTRYYRLGEGQYERVESLPAYNL
ncbi:MAG: type I restriction enzyme HsdR N-terminal domain-containing protein [Fibrobacteria bacterium]|nr:type I restriction enzyme HsdR N-terminal domain-containing protein [Fibrobacteria bacterium]